MNKSPVPPFQPNTEETPPVVTPVLVAEPQILTPTPKGSEKLALWSLILGIASLVLVILIPISIPAAIIAIIFGIIVLTKKRLGKGKALAGIITGGCALLLVVPLLAIAIVAYNGVTERANNVARQQEVSQSGTPYSDGATVNTLCYTYDIPRGFQYDNASAHCTTAVNIPKGDSLTRIVVKPNTGTIGTLAEVVAAFNKTLKSSDPSSAGVIDQTEFTSGGHAVYYITYKDTYGLLFGNYIIPETTTLKDENGTTITAYTVAGYANLPQLKEVLDSLTIK